MSPRCGGLTIPKESQLAEIEMMGPLRKEIIASEESLQRAKQPKSVGAGASPWPHAASHLLLPGNERAVV